MASYPPAMSEQLADLSSPLARKPVSLISPVDGLLLPGSSYQRLRLLYLLPGGAALEWQLHRRMNGCRVLGEWFYGKRVPALLDLVSETADRMVADYNGSGRPPVWSDYIETLARPKAAERSMTVRLVEPTPVDPGEAAQRRAAHWSRPYRNQRLDAA